MATGGAGTATTPQSVAQPIQRNTPQPSPLTTVSPPSRRELASWWKKFRKTTEKTDEKGENLSARRASVTVLLSYRPLRSYPDNNVTDLLAVETQPGIFGVPLADSIRYANVAISLQNENGESFIYGYVPIVVAKCGVFLKEKGAP